MKLGGIVAALLAATAASGAFAASQTAHVECAAQYGITGALPLVPIGPGLYAMGTSDTVSAAAAAQINDCARVSSFTDSETAILLAGGAPSNFFDRIFNGRPRGLCPYPHRPSDAVFRNGSGYIIKDDVRADLGCR